MTIKHRWLAVGCLVLLIGGVLAVAAAPALAGAPDAVKTAKRAETETLQNLILLFVAVVILSVGIGAGTATLRIVFPDIASRADTAVRRLGTGRLFVTGILPLIGGGLLAVAAEKAHAPGVELAYLLIVAIPLFLAILVGAMAALPYLGARLIKNGEEAGILKQASIGGGVIGVAAATWIIPPLGGFLTFVVLGWLLGVGIGTALPPRAAPLADPVPAPVPAPEDDPAPG